MAIPTTMKAIAAQGGKCVFGDRPVPAPAQKEVLVKVHYTAINRADTLQRTGKYPPPPGVTDILGLEFAGEVIQHGSGCILGDRFPVGARVMGLLSGGGNAEYTTINEQHLISIPDGLSYKTAAAIPETWLTAYQLLFFVGHAKAGETVLVHAAASGVGTAAVQMANKAGVKVIAVAGSDDKLDAVKALGADYAVNYKAHPDAWAAQVLPHTAGKGVNLILDPVGASHWKQNAESIAMDGRWVLYGSMGGISVEGPLFGAILRKRIQIQGTTLRARSDEYKAELTQEFTDKIMPLLESGALKPVVDKEFELSDVQTAHDYMESNANIGKIVLKVAGEEVG